MKNSRVLLEEIALGKTMGEGMAKICDSHSIQSKSDPEGGKKGGGVAWEHLSLPYKLMKVPQSCWESSNQRQPTTATGLLLLTTGILPKCLVIRLQEPVGNHGLGANVSMDLKEKHLRL